MEQHRWPDEGRNCLVLCAGTQCHRLSSASPNMLFVAHVSTLSLPSASFSLQSHPPTPWSCSKRARMMLTMNGLASVSVLPTSSMEDWASSRLPFCWCVCFLEGTTPLDPSSDWYAPVEHWGNYEGVAVMAAPPVKKEPAPRKVSLKLVCHVMLVLFSSQDFLCIFPGFLVLHLQVSESENREDLSDGTARAKKRRRRKKNTEEEGASNAQVR